MIKTRRIGVKAFLILFLTLILTGCLSRSVLVKFESNGGTPVKDVLVPIGELLEKPEDPKKEGYEFSGWYKDIDLTEEFKFDQPIENDLTLYAKWNAAKYTITWETNGGSEIEPTEISYRGTINAPENPTRTGYVFGGWYYEEDFQTLFDFRTLMPAKSFTLYARWSLGEFKVSFETNGGSTISPIEGLFGEKFTVPVTNKHGYTFAGWYLDPEFETEFTEFKIPSQDTVLYAKWEPVDLEVTFVLYPGNSYTTTVKYNEKLNQPEDPQRIGYTFKNWKLDGENYDFSKPVIDEITLEAEWERNQYTVSFETNGGSHVESVKVLYNNTFTKPEDPTKTGYEFIGWFKDETLQTEWNFAQDKVTEDITLYAKWEVKTFTINFVTDADPIAPITQKFGTELVKPEDPTKTGYSFAGWYRDSLYRIPFEFPDTMPAENITLYARWTANLYKLTYLVDGEVYDEVFIEFGGMMPMVPSPEKVGHTFQGWSDLPATMPAKDITVNAVFTVNSYRLTYIVEGVEYKYFWIPFGTAIEPLDYPEKVGYTFEGWSDIPETMPAQSYDVYGSFKVNYYELNVVTDEARGTVSVNPEESSVAFGSEVTVSATPLPGYKFSHWYNGTAILSSERNYTFPMPAQQLTLTAIFVPEDNVEYNIIYFGETLAGDFAQLDAITLHGKTEDEVSAEIREFTGFTFASEYEGNVLTGKIKGDGSLELHVYYTRNSYTLTYNADGELYSEIYKYQASIVSREGPEKVGYTFRGWNGLPATMPAKSISVEADYELIEYTIDYNLGGGSFEIQPRYKYNVESEFTVPNPTRNGYQFGGWTYEGVVEPVKDLKINRGTYGNLTLVANWQAETYQVYYFDGPYNLDLEPNVYTIATGLVLPTPSKTGYSFEGWYTNSEFVGEAVTEIAQGEQGDRNYYAKFVPETYTITYYNGSEVIADSNLINEYTYSETQAVTLKMLPEKTGYSFAWLNEQEDPVTKIPAGTTGNLVFYAKYTVKTYDVYFYHERGDLIGTVENVAYGSDITLAMAFAGKPLYVQKLIELNTNIILLNKGQMSPAEFQGYLLENAAGLKEISENIASSLETVFVQQDQASIEALMLASQSELGKLAQPLDVKISLLQTLKNKLVAVVQDPTNALLGQELFIYLYASQGAYSSYMEDLATEIGKWLDSTGTDQDAFQNINSYVTFELNNSTQIRYSFRKDHPTKNGYVFIGWKLGSDTLYETYGEGYLFDGTIVMVPASGIPGEPAKVIAAYKRLEGLSANFNAANNLLTWNSLSQEVLSTLYDAETETIKVSYDIYIEDQNGNLYKYANTIFNKVELDNPGTYKVKVIPVVEIYEDDVLINTVSASIVNAEGMEVTVKKLEDEAVLDKSGNYYHRAIEGGQYVYYFFSNTEITFPGSNFTILSGDAYVTVNNGNTLVLGDQYTTSEKNVEFTFTAQDGGPVYLARIYPYISQYELGESLTDYQNTVNNINGTLYYDKEVEPYYVGKAIIGTDESDVLDNDNAFYFDLLIKTTGGKKLELPASELLFKAYEVIDGTEVEVPISDTKNGDWQIYRDDKYFYFRESGKTYRIVIDIKDLYVPKILKADPENPDKPALIKPKSFTVKINDGINVFTNEELQIAYADTRVKEINIHRDIEAQLRPDQVYEVDGVTYPYNYYASYIVMLYNNGHVRGTNNGNVYQRISAADAENPDNLVINGNYFTIDGSKLPYMNYEPGNIGEVTIGSTVITQSGKLNTIPGYKIRNVQAAIFNHISLDTVNPAEVNYGGVTYKNLTIIGNTQTPNIDYSEGASQIEEALEIMGRNSGGYVAIANNFNLTLAVDNVVIGSSTIAVWSSTETNVIVNNAHLYNSWANTVYVYGCSYLSIANAILEESGGAAVHIEDTKFSSDYAQTINFDTSTVEVNNWVSGEEPWFKSYSMELAAMKMKSDVNSAVRALNASILRNIVDENSGLISRKMNFVMLILPVGQQLSPTENEKKDIPAEKWTTPGYTDMTINMLQSSHLYDYDAPYEGKYVVQIRELITALPFGEIKQITLESGVSELGTPICTNFIAVPADLSAVGRGHGILVLGLDNKISS